MQGQRNWSLCQEPNSSAEIHQVQGKASTVSEHVIETATGVAIVTETWLQDEDFNKSAIPNNKFQMASGQGSHWLIESPTIFSSMCSLPLSDIC